MYILMSGAMLTHTPVDKIDLTGSIPQALAAAFAGGSAGDGIDWGLLLGRVAIIALAISVVAAYSVVLPETSRLPRMKTHEPGREKMIPGRDPHRKRFSF